MHVCEAVVRWIEYTRLGICTLPVSDKSHQLTWIDMSNISMSLECADSNVSAVEISREQKG